ncbi:hypothetical protein [Caballeronia sp. LZ034LL]|uniref:hypothetical protein n=1 Tax=Caballeronia sp. LZ034LL TaxID=3038567 RepID=UPI002858BFEB|nr:hypothetical protein [Caballeronia sp. LZ034LL]MDR5839293.1 hypothetical protein [Caballeronia sp. LZ034LL]
MATAQVRNQGIEITLSLTQEEAIYLKAMMQNSAHDHESSVEEGVRRVIFQALKDAGVS